MKFKALLANKKYLAFGVGLSLACTAIVCAVLIPNNMMEKEI